MAQNETFIRPLYHNSKISLDKALHLLQIARQRHKMTDACFECILRLLSNGGILPDTNNLPTTIRTFQKMVTVRSTIKTLVDDQDEYVIFDFVEQLKSIVTSNIIYFHMIKYYILKCTFIIMIMKLELTRN